MTPGPAEPRIDSSRPRPARVCGYLLGGRDHCPVCQALGERMPPRRGTPSRRTGAFPHRAAGWASRWGIAPFLDIGTGIAAQPNLHQRPGDQPGGPGC